MMFVKTPMQFYIVRFLLGVAEAGLLAGHHAVPDVLVPGDEARPRIALFMTWRFRSRA